MNPSLHAFIVRSQFVSKPKRRAGIKWNPLGYFLLVLFLAVIAATL